jgi:NAD(P)-dependent dehydrogenase (short-subunit alcohol dehydrogenase family)
MRFLYSQLFVTPVYPTASCAGQTIIVTGSNVGLGKETTRHFARLGASKIILAVRDNIAGEAVKKDIETSTQCGPDVLDVWPLDLLSYESCRSFADRASKLPRLDVLLENAGVAGNKWSLAGRHERMVAVNVISIVSLSYRARSMPGRKFPSGRNPTPLTLSTTSPRLEWENDTLPASSSKSLLSDKLHLSWKDPG